MLDLKVAAQMQEIERLNQLLPEKDVTIKNQTTGNIMVLPTILCM